MEHQPEEKRPRPGSTPQTPADQRRSGEEPATSAPRSPVGAPADARASGEGDLTKAQAEKRIDEGRSGRRWDRAADEDAEAEVRARIADSLERIATTLEHILPILTRLPEGDRGRPRPEFRNRPMGQEGQRDSRYGGQRFDRYRDQSRRPGRRWGREGRPDRRE